MPKPYEPTDARTYTSLRQEVKRDLEHLFPNAIILTLKQAAKAYGYTDTQTAKEMIGAPRIPGERRVAYYLGDIASDIARKRLG